MKAFNRIQFLGSKLILPGAMLCALLLFAPVAKAGPGSTTPWSVPYSWCGFYIGANLGGIFGFYDAHGPIDFNDADGREFFTDVNIAQQYNDRFSDNFADQFVTFFGPAKRGEFDGAVTGGGQTGFMFQFGHFVVGVEGDFNRTALNSAFVSTGSNVGDGPFLDESDVIAETEFHSTTHIDTNWTGSARLRFGYAQGAMLFYATGGGVWSDVNVRINQNADTNFFLFTPPPPPVPDVIVAPPAGPPNSEFIGSQHNTLLGKDDDIRGGWTAGAGIDVAVSDNVLIGLEYRHNDFGGETYHFSSHGGPIFPGSTHVDFDSDQVTFRFNILFSGLFGHH